VRTPVTEDRLLTDDAAQDPRLRNALTFLSYEEKLCAGSWRFNTYFGRDTLMSVRLLAPVLQPEVVEAGLRAVIERLNPQGEVAHEEDVGEFAILRRLDAGHPRDDVPILDYRMIDDDYLLPVVAEYYLLELATADRAATFLARTTPTGETYGAALARNFAFVVGSAEPFAANPDWQHLIALKPGQAAGNWRDSAWGLGNGRYPYDVNGVFVPAALTAIGRITYTATRCQKPWPTSLGRRRHSIHLSMRGPSAARRAGRNTSAPITERATTAMPAYAKDLRKY
jgi:hypothetical protein